MGQWPTKTTNYWKTRWSKSSRDVSSGSSDLDAAADSNMRYVVGKFMTLPMNRVRQIINLDDDS